MVVLWNTALTVAGILFYRRNSRQHEALHDHLLPEIMASRYAPPVEDSPDTAFPAMLDTSGAWAMEQANMGRRIADEEIQLQRDMRHKAGL